MQFPIALLLDRSRAETLTDQLVAQLRDAIRLGRIPPGLRLPSSRRLSEQLGIGRNTVVRAYDILLMEAWVEARPACGIFASANPQAARPGRLAAPTCRLAALLAPPAKRLVPPAVPAGRARISYDFAPGPPGASLVPLKLWRRLVQGALSQGGAGAVAAGRSVRPAGAARRARQPLGHQPGRGGRARADPRHQRGGRGAGDRRPAVPAPRCAGGN